MRVHYDDDDDDDRSTESATTTTTISTATETTMAINTHCVANICMYLCLCLVVIAHNGLSYYIFLLITQRK